MKNKIQWMRVVIIAVVCNGMISIASGKEISLGNTHAPVTLIEYGSLTCSNCVRFHRTVFPRVKEAYIDTGTVRFIYRHFPTSDAAAQGALAVQCAGDKFYEMLDELYSSAHIWYREESKNKIFTQQADLLGLDLEVFSSCINDEYGLEDILNQRDKARKDDTIFGTPTFIINGRIVRGIKTFHEIDGLIQEALGEDRVMEELNPTATTVEKDAIR